VWKQGKEDLTCEFFAGSNMNMQDKNKMKGMKVKEIYTQVKETSDGHESHRRLAKNKREKIKANLLLEVKR